MPVGYVIGLAVAGVWAVAALRPPRSPRWAARTAHVVGLVPSELPHTAAALLVASAVPAVVADGLLATPAGRIAAVVTAAVLAAFLVVAVWVDRAGPALAGALARDLPMAPEMAVRGRVRRWLRSLVMPFPVRPRSVERLADMAYGPAGRRNRLDVYRSRDARAGAPVLVYFHGGGYVSGGKRWGGQAMLHRLAADGWVCVSATYRLRPAAGFAEHLADARRALAWTVDHARDLGADPATVVVAGSSAGAHLAAHLGLAPGGSGAPQVAAVVGLAGYYGRYYGGTAGECPPSAPTDHDADGAPPFLLVHGELDGYVPVEGAREFAAWLRRGSSRPVVLAELPGAQHGFDALRSPREEAVTDAVRAFLAAVTAWTPAR